MKKIIITTVLLILMALGLWLQACTSQSQPPPQVINSPTPASDSLGITAKALDQLLEDKAFTAVLKSKVQLTEQQLASLKQISTDEMARLTSVKAENQKGEAEASDDRLVKSIRDLLGKDKADQVLALAAERKSEQIDTATAQPEELTPLKGPNAVPTDTRIVVNIPAFRMDVFREGTLLKSFKIGIGYQEYPLPTGFRKAEMIIFNPTWTQPNEPWASSPGLVVPAGAKGNPLGPIKIPIGGANLIHGGKVLAKIGTFASHGCVGLTNDEVKDFAKVLAEATNTELSSETIASYLKHPTRTRVVKLTKPVPVELRYETIVVEDGKLHVYRDVYNKKTNTEENLRAVLEANKMKFEELSDGEKNQALEALDVISGRLKKQAPPAVSGTQSAADRAAAAAERKAEAARLKKLRNQKEIVIELAGLTGKGYPAPVNLNTGAPIIASVQTPKRPN